MPEKINWKTGSWQRLREGVEDEVSNLTLKLTPKITIKIKI